MCSDVRSVGEGPAIEKIGSTLKGIVNHSTPEITQIRTCSSTSLYGEETATPVLELPAAEAVLVDEPADFDEPEEPEEEEGEEEEELPPAEEVAPESDLQNTVREPVVKWT